MSIIIHDTPIADTNTRTTPGVAIASHLLMFLIGVMFGASWLFTDDEIAAFVRWMF